MVTRAAAAGPAPNVSRSIAPVRVANKDFMGFSRMIV
jgi:hypothetical protein